MSTYVLWLASWYPNRLFPFEGDFIQRHAYAVSEKVPITLIHVFQYAENIKANENRIEAKVSGNLTEISISFKYFKTGIRLIDKIIYNFRYRYCYKKYLFDYFKKNGLPLTVHVNIPMKAGLIARWIKHKWEIPYLVTEHSSSYEESSSDYFMNKSLFYKRSVYKIFNSAEAITNVSNKMGKRVFKLTRLDKKIEVIPNVVNESMFFYNDYKCLPFTFIHVSTFSDQKNIYEMLGVFKSLHKIRKDWRLLLVGPAGKDVIQFGFNLQMGKNIFFTGEVSYPKVAEIMQQSSALVLFSLHENLPCVIEEALCCGLPVISSDVGGIEEAVNDTNGILVPINGNDELLSALQKIIDNYDVFDRKEIAQKANELYNRKVIADKFYELYKKIIKPSTF